MKAQEMNYLEFRFLPYLPLEQEISFGNVIFWPYYKSKNIYIKKKETKSQIEKYLKRYLDNSSKKSPLAKITIASYRKRSNFRPLNNKEELEVLDAAHSLAFCILICNHAPFHAFSSENFQVVSQRFQIGDNRIATYAGSYNRIHIQGQQIDDVIFIQPLYIHCSPYTTLDAKLLCAIEKARHDEKNLSLYRRLIDSFRWVSYAHSNIDGFPYATRVVMMTVAFEILLDGFNGKLGLMKKFRRYLCNSYTNRPEYCQKRQVTIKGKKETLDCSRIEWWAYDFYNLRNQIVHGRSIAEKDYSNSKGRDYFSLSIRFFQEILKRELSRRGYYAYDNDMDLLKWVGIYDEL